MRQLEQVSFVEQPHLDRTCLYELLDCLRAQRCNPVDTVQLLQCVYLLLADHPAVAHQHEPLYTEVLSDLLYLRQQRFRITRISVENRYGHRDAVLIGQQPVVDLELAFLAVAVVSERRQRARHALEVAGGEVVERHAIVVKVTSRQPFLDEALAFEQPVHRGVQVVLVRVSHAQRLWQRGRMPPRACRQFRLRFNDARDNHSHHEAAFPAGA